MGKYRLSKTGARGVILLLLLLILAAPAQADGGAEDLARLMNGDSLTPVAGAAADGTLRLTPDRVEVVRLDQNAASVVVANPEHAEIILDSPRLLVVMPRRPGATSFTVLNGQGETILEKSVIVSAAARPNYVRVRRICGSQDAACAASAYFYCPDGCYEVSPVSAQGPAQIPPVAATGAASLAGGAGTPAQGMTPDMDGTDMDGTDMGGESEIPETPPPPGLP